MKSIILVVALLFFSGLAVAQVSGFLGKRALLEYSAQVNPYGTEIWQTQKIGFQHGIHLKYVLNRKDQLGLQFSFSRPDLAALPDFETLSEAQFFSTGIQYANYNAFNGAIAPYGSYFDYSLKYLRGTAFDASQFSDEEWQATRLFAGIGLGKRFILWRLLSLDIGTHIGFSLPLDRTEQTETLHLALRRMHNFEMRLGLGFLIF